ncbi:MAG: hypothetical protein Q9225_004915 [Loekoesia sp. 1 TL-2023]
MANRITRGAAAKQAALKASGEKEDVKQQPPAAPAKQKKTAVAKTAEGNDKAAVPKRVSKKAPTARKASIASKSVPTNTPTKRNSIRKVKNHNAVEGIPEDKEANSTAETVPKQTTSEAKKSAQVKGKDIFSTSATATKKRKRAATPKLEEDPDELPHGLGKLWKPSDAEAQMEDTNIQEPLSKNKAGAEAAAKPEEASTPAVDSVQASAAAVAAITPSKDPPAKKSPKKKANPYGLTPGVTPFPDWPHPTPEECQQVNDLLSTIHGKVKAPEKIPEPSLTFAGCGEVPCVLDALIRTYLSSATSGDNSSRAFKGLLDEYGQQETGIGKGSVNWDAVRRSDVSRVFNAIRSGGLAAVKSKNIKKILDMVYEENQTRRDALVEAKEGKIAESEAAAKLPKGAENESEDAKILEIARANKDILSLDHLHAMSKEDAFNHMLQYPGIGVKTASCVTLFCLRRPSFAVDTHVFRLCQWLGWVPKNATRDTTYNHCEVRVPDELKYSLHQLLIMHGKKCGRCRAITGESSEGWEKGCVIDHLVTRTGVRKGGEASPVKGKKRKKDEEDESEGDSGEGSDIEASPGKTKTKKSAKESPKKTPIKSKEKVKKEGAKTTKTPARSKAGSSKGTKNQRKSATNGENVEEAAS